jgi:endonuclease/exonuclease/phosphatase family metal-dependent hydrolase
VIWARIETPEGQISCACTHLNSIANHGANRVLQLTEVMALLASKESVPASWAPPILCGDLNATEHSDEIRYVKGDHAAVTSTAEMPSSSPLAMVDTWQSANAGTAPIEGHTMLPSNRHAGADCYSRRIDYIFVGAVRNGRIGHVENCRVIGDARFCKEWPSDHMGVFAEIRTKSSPKL